MLWLTAPVLGTSLTLTRVSGPGRQGAWCGAGVGWVTHGGQLPLLLDAGTGKGLLFSCTSPPSFFSRQSPGNFPFPLKGTSSSSGASPLARCGSCALPWVDVGRAWGCQSAPARAVDWSLLAPGLEGCLAHGLPSNTVMPALCLLSATGPGPWCWWEAPQLPQARCSSLLSSLPAPSLPGRPGSGFWLLGTWLGEVTGGSF